MNSNGQNEPEPFVPRLALCLPGGSIPAPAALLRPYSCQSKERSAQLRARADFEIIDASSEAGKVPTQVQRYIECRRSGKVIVFQPGYTFRGELGLGIRSVQWAWSKSMLVVSSINRSLDACVGKAYCSA